MCYFLGPVTDSVTFTPNGRNQPNVKQKPLKAPTSELFSGSHLLHSISFIVVEDDGEDYEMDFKIAVLKSNLIKSIKSLKKFVL